MPELPDLETYLDALRERILLSRLAAIRVRSPFLVRSYDPPLREANGRQIRRLSRMGKRIVFELSGDYALVLHLMISGRLKWGKSGAGIPGRGGLAAFDFSSGTLLVTEAGSKRRASLYLVRGREQLVEHDPGGLEVLDSDLATFSTTLLRKNHTLKRALSDPRILSGIGNAFSDEILHRAGLSPLRQTSQLEPQEIEKLFKACRHVLSTWVARLDKQRQGKFPLKVTAFKEGMAVHGRFREPCPVCQTPVQRIVYKNNETNYCPTCQTGGRILADRALSRLLAKDWPRTLDELELRRPGTGVQRGEVDKG